MCYVVICLLQVGPMHRAIEKKPNLLLTWQDYDMSEFLLPWPCSLIWNGIGRQSNTIIREKQFPYLIIKEFWGKMLWNETLQLLWQEQTVNT